MRFAILMATNVAKSWRFFSYQLSAMSYQQLFSFDFSNLCRAG